MKLKLILLEECRLWNVQYIMLLCYFCDVNLKFMVGLATEYRLRYLELYLNSIPKHIYSSFSVKYT